MARATATAALAAFMLSASCSEAAAPSPAPILANSLLKGAAAGTSKDALLALASGEAAAIALSVPASVDKKYVLREITATFQAVGTKAAQVSFATQWYLATDAGGKPGLAGSLLAAWTSSITTAKSRTLTFGIGAAGQKLSLNPGATVWLVMRNANAASVKAQLGWKAAASFEGIQARTPLSFGAALLKSKAGASPVWVSQASPFTGVGVRLRGVPAPPPTCKAPTVACKGECVNPLIDALNCGGCNKPCAAGDVCINGACDTPCPNAEETKCEGLCVDKQSDSFHCGVCNNECPRGKDCIAGECKVPCPTDQVSCRGECVDTKQDSLNCGSCGTTCQAITEFCESGACQPAPCTISGETRCSNGSCYNLVTDTSNCGTCGNACDAGKVCEAGSCTTPCSTGQTRCGGVCMDTNTDAFNCGSCGTKCSVEEVCTSGKCCLLGFANCNGICVMLDSNDNCGSCGSKCLGGICEAGLCI